MQRLLVSSSLAFALALLLGGCSDDGSTSPDGAAKVDGRSLEASADQSAGGDATGPCAACKSDEVCVQNLDGTCSGGPPTCRKVSASCVQKKGARGAACDSGCESEYCGGSPYQCATQSACGKEDPTADIYCYGP